MKTILLKIVLILFSINLSNAQAWMTNLEIAQNLALAQNKMVLMVWEDATLYDYPVLVENDKGQTLLVENLFTDEAISPLIWENFVPVIVSEYAYADLYNAIKDNRSQQYIDKFNDDSIKIMDVNGNILNVSSQTVDYQNITSIISKYSLNTEILAAQLEGYKKEKNFYSAYYLASKYLDVSLYLNEETRIEMVGFSNIYLEEARQFIGDRPNDEQLALTQRVELLKIQEDFIYKRPKRVLRQLKRMDAENFETINLPEVAFLYYTAYRILNDNTNIALWESKISLVNLKKAQLLINLNS
ncbi:hypothetical protein DFQ11_10777 [Winogradskyella epiphytica]|uniref:Uncharacterized protein n=1 Tax=Winogradskyella epiphytica TaxID=262005 RepID=A0A2V4XQK1_9FLAO|nr:hypothetical protein [Winogradskyella epiphytica]PYE80107.1 hypothetical protein DFQ11_10777 [Winogradskyella epiphytica]GGW71461.1 hypothetical protein GCM10008085_24390 [Winogradskyella epiphytica]